MNSSRRQLLKQGALAAAAFAFSRDAFARHTERLIAGAGFSDAIRIGSNENPHGPSPLARKAMVDAVNGSNRYQWTITMQLREKLAAAFKLTKDHIAIGAGSSEFLGVVSLMAVLRKGHAVAPDPTFFLWMSAARKMGLPVKLVPLGTNKTVDLQRLKDALDDDTRMVYICNPNNPTGTVIPASELEAFIRAISPRCIILLDEAYTEFSDEPSMASLVNDCPNLVIAKTFSKIYGLAGARVGFAIAHPDTIRKLNDLQPWANAGASAVSLAGAMASLGDTEFVNFCRKENQKARNILYSALEKTGMPYVRSNTSFVYFDSTPYNKDVREVLESQQIIGARTFEQGTKWLRLSIGTVEEMERVKEVITLKA